MRGVLRIIRPYTRASIAREIERLPDGFEVVIREPTRTKPQNAKFWAMLSDVATAQIEGRRWSTETWKCALMQSYGYEMKWEQGLNGDPLPLGFRSSKLRKAQMIDLITFTAEYGDRHGVQWSGPNPYEVDA